MKRTAIGVVSGMVLIALVLGVLPVSASESEGSIVETSNHLSQSGYYPNAFSSSATRYDCPPLTTPVGERLTFTLSATDPDTDPLTYSASSLPPGATFNPQTRAFTWMPSVGQQGIYPGIRFEVSGGGLGDSEEITITVATSEEAVFSVNSLRVRPGKVNAGKQVRISVLAANTGTFAGSCEVTLRINGTIEDNRVVALSPGASEEVNFVTSKDVAGVYMVDVNGLADSFVVRGTASGRGKAKTVSLESILSKTLGWIRMILQSGGEDPCM